jgi:DNA replication protein DnaC
MDRLQAILTRFGSDTTSDFDPKAWEQFKVDDWNNTPGNRHEEDGFNCPICKNKGSIAKLLDYGNGTYSHCFADCKCVETRNSIMRMKRSGLKDIIKDYTFDKFIASENWQQTIKEAAVNYSENPNGWFALFGQSGCGKTHLCTAISRKFLLDGRRVVYMLWRDEIVRIKDAARGGDDSEELRKLLDRYKTADVLYIDDLFKTGRSADNTMPKPTPADINYAFEIINYRYNNPALLTIISSEMSIDELLDVDEAIGGRIYERATAFTIGKSREKNYRLKKAVTL